MSANTVLLDELEESLLRNLASSTGNILDNEELIGTLESAKSKSVEISAKLAESEVTKIDINKTRAAYAPAAKRGSILFFAMAGRAWGGGRARRRDAAHPLLACLLPLPPCACSQQHHEDVRDLAELLPPRLQARAHQR